MANSSLKKEVIAISDDLINQAIKAIESTEPTSEELEAEQLAKLVPAIRAALNRRESRDKIHKKIKSALPKLHYKKIKALLALAAEPASDQHELTDQTDQLLDGVQ